VKHGKFIKSLISDSQAHTFHINKLRRKTIQNKMSE